MTTNSTYRRVTHTRHSSTPGALLLLLRSESGVLTLTQSTKSSLTTAICRHIQNPYTYLYKSPKPDLATQSSHVSIHNCAPESTTTGEYLPKSLIVFSKLPTDHSVKTAERGNSFKRALWEFHDVSVLKRKSFEQARVRMHTHPNTFFIFPNCNGTEQKFSVWEPSELITITIHN